VNEESVWPVLIMAINASTVLVGIYDCLLFLIMADFLICLLQTTNITLEWLQLTDEQTAQGSETWVNTKTTRFFG